MGVFERLVTLLTLLMLVYFLYEALYGINPFVALLFGLLALYLVVTWVQGGRRR